MAFNVWRLQAFGHWAWRGFRLSGDAHCLANGESFAWGQARVESTCHSDTWVFLLASLANRQVELASDRRDHVAVPTHSAELLQSTVPAKN